MLSLYLTTTNVSHDARVSKGIVLEMLIGEIDRTYDMNSFSFKAKIAKQKSTFFFLSSFSENKIVLELS